jgi:hypothetical protein
MSTNDTGARAATRAMADGRRADSDRRRQRVLTTLAWPIVCLLARSRRSAWLV